MKNLQVRRGRGPKRVGGTARDHVSVTREHLLQASTLDIGTFERLCSKVTRLR